MGLGCNESEKPLFDNNHSALYFQSGDDITIDFANFDQNLYRYTLKVPIYVKGSELNADRNYKIEVLSDETNAIEGVDYVPFKTEYVFSKGLEVDSLSIHLLNHDRHTNQTINLVVQLIDLKSDNGIIPERKAINIVMLNK